jgi:hypothetical protein
MAPRWVRIHGFCQIFGKIRYGPRGIDIHGPLWYNLRDPNKEIIMVMSMDEWYEERVVKPKQDWARVSREAKLTKLKNKMSKRDIERETRIEALGGNGIEVRYGVPLSEELRKERIEIELDLKYPKRKEKKVKKTRPTRNFIYATGENRSKEQFVHSVLMGAKCRAKTKGIPFNLSLEDIKIPEVCPVLKIPLVWGDRLTNNTPTVDRVVPEKGYVKGNCVVISMKANRLKNNASKEDLEAILEYVTNHSKFL